MQLGERGTSGRSESSASPFTAQAFPPAEGWMIKRAFVEGDPGGEDAASAKEGRLGIKLSMMKYY